MIPPSLGIKSRMKEILSMKHLRQTRLATATLTLLLVVTCASFWRAKAEEGMFLPDAISTLPLDKLLKRELKITSKDLYEPIDVSIKDAVVIVGGGNGEFVSPNGLLLTNHHVAFDGLVTSSSAANDYGRTGYRAN